MDGKKALRPKVKFQIPIRSVFGKTVCACLLLSVVQVARGISYPYELGREMTASLDVNTHSTIALSHMLLGVNDGGRSYYGYNSTESQAQVRSYQPLSIRWPTGVWSNFYDWEVDGRRIYDGYSSTYYDAVVNHSNFRYGFPGFHELHEELGFDVLWTWNINYDSVEKGIRRLKDRQAKGFEVRWIELGNEIFWKNQRSDIVNTPAKYVQVARAHALALKAEDPRIQTSVPATWRGTGLHKDWNNALRSDTSYYDAISVHKYVRPGESFKGAKEVLRAGQIMLQTAKDMRALFPDKPIWLSEWSVDCGDNALSCIGMADVYLCFINHTEMFAMSQYHQASGNMEPFYEYDSKTRAFTKTSYGAVYEVIRLVFENAEMYDSVESSTNIVSGLQAVHAEAVVKDDELRVFALNKSTKHVSFTLRFNGLPYTDSVDHQALAFSGANDFKLFAFEENVLADVAFDTDTIVLPPLSLNVISDIQGIAIGSSTDTRRRRSARNEGMY